MAEIDSSSIIKTEADKLRNIVAEAAERGEDPIPLAQYSIALLVSYAVRLALAEEQPAHVIQSRLLN